MPTPAEPVSDAEAVSVATDAAVEPIVPTEDPEVKQMDLGLL